MIHIIAATHILNKKKKLQARTRRCLTCRKIQLISKTDSNKTVICKNCGEQIPAKIVGKIDSALNSAKD